MVRAEEEEEGATGQAPLAPRVTCLPVCPLSFSAAVFVAVAVVPIVCCRWRSACPCFMLAHVAIVSLRSG